MRVYLDNCALNRPFDDQTQPRVRVETEAIELILTKIEEETWTWYSSQVVVLENQQTPDTERRDRIEQIMAIATEVIEITEPIEARAVTLEVLGFKPFDALHLAAAESASLDFFVTCDDKLCKRAKRFSNKLKVRVVNPIELIREGIL